MLKSDYTIKERKADEQVKVQKGRLIKEIIIVLLCMVLGSALIEPFIKTIMWQQGIR